MSKPVDAFAQHLIDKSGFERRQAMRSLKLALSIFEKTYLNFSEDGEPRSLVFSFLNDDEVVAKPRVKVRGDFDIYLASLTKREQRFAAAYIKVWTAKLKAVKANVRKQQSEKFVCDPDLYKELAISRKQRLCLHCGASFDAPTDGQRLFCPPAADALRSACNDGFHSWLASLRKSEVIAIQKLGGQKKITIGQTRSIQAKQFQSMLRRYRMISGRIFESITSKP